MHGILFYLSVASTPTPLITLSKRDNLFWSPFPSVRRGIRQRGRLDVTSRWSAGSGLLELGVSVFCVWTLDSGELRAEHGAHVRRIVFGIVIRAEH